MNTELKPIDMTHKNKVTWGEIYDIAKNEPLLHQAAESMMRKCYDLFGYDIPFDENQLKGVLVDNLYKYLARGAKKAMDFNSLCDAEYYRWTDI